jgi:hypothetical protein
MEFGKIETTTLVTAYFPNKEGPSDPREILCRKIFSENGGEFNYSEYYLERNLDGSSAREIGYDIPNEKVEYVKEKLVANGFRLTDPRKQ